MLFCVSGDPDTNEVAWDCDCRPSDGCWLSLKVFVTWKAYLFLLYCFRILTCTLNVYCS